MQHDMSFYILMALIGELGFMTLSILAKRLRMRGTKSHAILGVYGLTMPVWVGIVAYFAMADGLNLPWQYLACLVAWLAVCYGLNFGSIFVSGFQSLSEATGYRFGFSVAIAILLDILVFGTQFDPALLGVIGVLFAGGILLHTQRKAAGTDTKGRPLVPLHYKIGLISLISVAEVSTYALFKYAAQMQSDVFLHNAMFQAVLFTMFLIVGGRLMLRDCRDGYMPTCYVVAMCALLLVAAAADGFAMAGLPVTMFIMFSLIRAACYAVHDIKTREVAANPVSLIGIALIAVGMIGMVVFKGL